MEVVEKLQHWLAGTSKSINNNDGWQTVNLECTLLEASMAGHWQQASGGLQLNCAVSVVYT